MVYLYKFNKVLLICITVAIYPICLPYRKDVAYKIFATSNEQETLWGAGWGSTQYGKFEFYVIFDVDNIAAIIIICQCQIIL